MGSGRDRNAGGGRIRVAHSQIARQLVPHCRRRRRIGVLPSGGRDVTLLGPDWPTTYTDSFLAEYSASVSFLGSIVDYPGSYEISTSPGPSGSQTSPPTPPWSKASSACSRKRSRSTEIHSLPCRKRGAGHDLPAKQHDTTLFLAAPTSRGRRQLTRDSGRGSSDFDPKAGH